MNDNDRKIYLAAIGKYGIDHQIKKSIEELAELQIELSRKNGKRYDRDKVLEEIADVQIMIDQLMFIFDTNPYKIGCIKKLKLDRLEKKISEE